MAYPTTCSWQLGTNHQPAELQESLNYWIENVTRGQNDKFREHNHSHNINIIFILKAVILWIFSYIYHRNQTNRFVNILDNVKSDLCHYLPQF